MVIRRVRMPLALAVATCLGALTACSSGADSRDVSATQTPFSASTSVPTATSNPSANTSPSPGAVMSSDGTFAFVVPGGWNLTKQAKTVAYLSSATSAHNVAPTIVVTRSSVTPAPALADTLRMATLQAQQDGGTVAAAPDRTIGGEKAVSFTATSKEHNVELKRTYVMVAHAKVLYAITLTGAAADADSDENVLTTVLASWTWAKAGVPGSTASGTTPAAIPTSTSSPASSSSSTSGSASTSPTGSRSAPSTGSARPSSTTSSSSPSPKAQSTTTSSTSTSH